MILVEIRPRGGAKQTIAVHPGVTVLRGLDPAARRTWATDIGRALLGETSASLDVEVEIEGKRQPLTAALVESLGLGGAGAAVTVFAVDLPGAKIATAAPATSPAASSRPDTEALEASVSAADATVRRLTGQLADAERSATSASDERTSAGRHVDKDAARLVAAADAELALARAAALQARDNLAAAEAVARASADAATASGAEAQAAAGRLRAEQTALEADRAACVARLVETGDPGEVAPVADALAGLRRLRSVKPKPSARAAEVADRWRVAAEQLSAMPQPPQPPEWLVIPAMAALQEAREALEAAEAGAVPTSIDPEKVEALDRAHREVLEAEQRAMKKGSRTNRRRLDAAHEVEQGALGALGVNSYGEYLQRIAPALEGGGTSGEDRVTIARAALADAEAVWEELHGGQASPAWTEAKEHQAAIRTEALALLAREVDDVHLERELRAQLETVVDTEWAEQALATALANAGGDVSGDGDLEGAAEAWLAAAPAVHEARAALEAELHELDAKLAEVEAKLAEQRAEEPVEGGPAATDGPIAALRAASDEADAAVAAAEAAVAAAGERQATSAQHEGRLAELEAEADRRRNEVDRLRLARDEATAALQVEQAKVAAAAEGDQSARQTKKASAAPAEAAASNGAVDLSAVVGMEAEAYLLARVAALRGAAGGPLPLVLDGSVLSGLSEGAARRVFRLLGRLAGSMQLVVFGDEEQIATWAEGLGDQGAVRSVAR